MPLPRPFAPALVVFDKDGTLLDFEHMWGEWARELAGRLERASGVAVASALYSALGYDVVRGRVRAGSPLAAHSMTELRMLNVSVGISAGLSAAAAEQAVAQAWFVPDPVMAARPVCGLAALFRSLRERGILTAIVTSDDRAPTLLTVESLGLARMTNAIVCADEGLPNKPEPDMLLRACHTLDVAPASAAVLGDGVPDLLAGRAAGFGACIGVLSGLSDRMLLEPYADALLPTVCALPSLLDNPLGESES